MEPTASQPRPRTRDRNAGLRHRLSESAQLDPSTVETDLQKIVRERLDGKKRA
jgi:hypothetical protein